MMPIAVAVLAAAVALVMLPALYLLALTLAGLLYRSPSERGDAPETRFAVLVPAHDEEDLLPRLLDSLGALDYPRDLYDVYVVADNCADATAEAARRGGATAFERHDRSLVGKGYALRWLLERVQRTGRPYDAYVFLDADSAVSSGFLSVMDARLRSGSDAVQCYYTVSNAAQSPVSALRHIALVLMHHARPKGRRVLGLSCGIFGTGMAFRREVVDRHGWDAYTLAEDVEYFLKLTEQGIRVDFAPEAVLWSDMPASLKEAHTQNLRWERGRLQMAWRYGLRFLVGGVVRRDPLRLDAGVEQLIPPISLTCAAAVLLLALSIPTGVPWLIGLALAVNAALAGHIVVGLWSARVPLGLWRALLFAPAFVAWKLWVYVQAALPGEVRWTRTERPGR